MKPVLAGIVLASCSLMAEVALGDDPKATELKTLQLQISALKTKRGTSKTLAITLVKVHGKKTSKYAREIGTIKEQLDRIKKELAALNGRKDDLEKRKLPLKQQLSSINGVKDAKLLEVSTADADERKKRAELNQKAGELSTKTTEHDKLQTKLEVKEAEATQKANELADKQSQLLSNMEAVAELDAKKCAVDGLKEKKEKVKAEVEGVKFQIAAQELEGEKRSANLDNDILKANGDISSKFETDFGPVFLQEYAFVSVLRKKGMKMPRCFSPVDASAVA